jgi:hypothetical protein
MIVVHAGTFGVALAASCTECQATRKPPASGSIRDSYEAFCAQHRHWHDEGR